MSIVVHREVEREGARETVRRSVPHQAVDHSREVHHLCVEGCMVGRESGQEDEPTRVGSRRCIDPVDYFAGVGVE